MADLNKVLLMGNLTRDPEVRHTPSGTAVADLGLAVSRKYNTKTGGEQEEVLFVTVTAWGRQAETCGQYLEKGNPILVEGRLKYDSWEKDGKKQSKITVTAERVQFLSRGGGGGAGGGGEFGDAAPSRNTSRSGQTDMTPQEEILDDNDDVPF